MRARLTKGACRCKALTLSALLISGLAAHAADPLALRNCVARAQGAAAITACETRQQDLLKARIERWTTALRKRLNGEQSAAFARNAHAWRLFFDSELDMLERTLLRRADGLGVSLHAGAVTRLYEERERQLREHLHNLSYVGQPTDTPSRTGE